MSLRILCLAILLTLCPVVGSANDRDFNTEVRPILSNKCLLCHGPDEESVEAGLRLDQREFAVAQLDSEETAIVPGKPKISELIVRITSDDESLRMPPVDHGAALTEGEIQILTDWVKQGAAYAEHWSYVPPVRFPVPSTDEHSEWGVNEIDKFVVRKMLQHGLAPSEPADRHAIIRRVFLDLTGLPPTVEEADAFANSQDPNAYEAVVDDLLQRPTFGEHWARKWLDLARYADSAGYADDPPRTIWAYRDWVIRSINQNMPFDQFTREQLAGDLFANPTTDQLIATAFHRNTLTNNEGGTQDEEFRNEAVVDRVNTTMAVWMGTTMACAQCHTHKYDPITQEEYFRFFAVFNNTQDADRRNESPTIPLYTEQQKQRRSKIQARSTKLTELLATPTAELQASQKSWEHRLRKPAQWKPVIPTTVRRTSGQAIQILDDGKLFVSGEPFLSVPMKDDYTIEVPIAAGDDLAAVRISVLPHENLPGKGSGLAGGNFVITNVQAEIAPIPNQLPEARYVRIRVPGQKQILSLAEVQIFSGNKNIAPKGSASQSSTDFNGKARLAIDGSTDGDYQKKSVTHTEISDDPWWEIKLPNSATIQKVVVWNRTDNDLQNRLSNFVVELLDQQRSIVFSQKVKRAPRPSSSITPTNVRPLRFRTALADYHQQGFSAAQAIAGKTGQNDGWAIGGAQQRPHHLVLLPERPVTLKERAILRLTIQHQSPHARHLLGHFAISTTSDATAIQRSALPTDLLAVLDLPAEDRNAQAAAKLADWFRTHAAPELKAQREELAAIQTELTNLKPRTSVPILRENTTDRRRTYLQFRGSYLDQGPEVQPGVPEVFLTSEQHPENRLQLAEWIIRPQNPLTARVLANRYWETIFGRGIVATSEEFGSQGELPTHPELLDWLATEVIRLKWDRKAVLKKLVMSATYRQSGEVDSNRLRVDSDNRWLSRGPRIRLSAEMVRDQALAAAGLLSDKMYGKPVNPPQPNLGLKAAFGGSTDWKTSTGEDRYRRGIYTTWRRSNPYPSMATFDAPNREVCTVRRNRTNTPLQSLVTLNDPVFVEAAQSLARLALQSSTDIKQQIANAFRRCLIRPPTDAEVAALVNLYEQSLVDFHDQPDDATALATDPLGPLPEDMPTEKAAAMTVVCNVLLNLDEIFLKR